jgi:glycosyltransferase involved in cell wall biosynthesis
MKPKVAVVRGKFLNRYEMQFYEPLETNYALTGFGSLTPYHDRFAFPVVKLPSPMDLPEFPYKMPVLNRLFTDAHYLYGLEEKLRGFDLVHTAETYFRYTQQALDAKRKGYVKKVIATVLENIPFNNEGIRGRKEYKRRARKELDYIIALTKKTKEVLIAEGADPKKITVISHFIDTKRFIPTQRKKSDLIILFVGRFEEYKGVMDVLNAAHNLLHDKDLAQQTLQFVFVGDGSQKKHMIVEEQRLGLTRNVVHRSVSYDDMPDVYAKADIFIAPSKPTQTYDEQYCTALLEAQASGLAIVTTRTGGIPENVSDAAILVKPGDVSAMAFALKSFILNTHLRSDYAKKARKRAVEVHDISIGSSKLAALYEQVLK